jgi:CDP-glycerol:poly(glycerophosphate) glycerophosphotransferase
MLGGRSVLRTIALTGLFLLTVLAGPVWAYLDPGTGSMLLAAVVGMVASLLFFLKGLFYTARRAVLGKAATDAATRHPLVLYSEGRQYWTTFRPILDELARRHEPCLYLTSDENDPGLLYASDLITTRHIGSGARAYATLAVLEAEVCAMTTPGIDVLQIRRSKGVKHYVHLVHAPTDIATYKQYSFDHFDSVFLNGDHQVRSLRKLEELRGTRRKALHKVGCLYYDAMRTPVDHAPGPVSGGSPTVLVAPTWGRNGLLTRVGARVLVPLLEQGWTVILRPHPQSHVSEPAVLERLSEELGGYRSLVWDREPDGTRSMARADVLVSDLSGIVFDFVFLFERPALTVRYDLDKAGQEAADLPWDPWEVTVLDTIGTRFDDAQLENLPSLIQRELGTRHRSEDIRRLRDEAVVNFGHAAGSAVDRLLAIRDGVTASAAA